MIGEKIIAQKSNLKNEMYLEEIKAAW
jgi:hypothetical protein